MSLHDLTEAKLEIVELHARFRKQSGCHKILTIRAYKHLHLTNAIIL